MCNFTLDDIRQVVREEIELSKNNKPKRETNSYISHDIMHGIVMYLNTVGGTKYTINNEMTKKFISARWKEGHKMEDFKAVINHKWKDWNKCKEMVKFFRPETLFGNKFESYLINASRKDPAKMKPYNEWTDIEKQVGKPKEHWTEKEEKFSGGM